MSWDVVLAPEAEKDLAKLSPDIRKQIYRALGQVSTLIDPHERGHALSGNLKGLWRYRVGDYRIICDIHKGALIILVIEVGHRSGICP